MGNFSSFSWKFTSLRCISKISLILQPFYKAIKMKKIFQILFFCVLLTLPLALQAQTKDTASVSSLSKIWTKLVSSSPLTVKNLEGNWNYRGSACTFETENLLKKAGGSLVASQVENKFDDYLTKIGIKQGACYFIFNEDSTYTAKLGLAKLSGSYSVNEKTKLVTMSYLLGMGKMRATAVKSGNNLKLMFDADNFLKMMKTLSMFTKDNSIEILAAMADMYDGMLLGFDLKKEKAK